MCAEISPVPAHSGVSWQFNHVLSPPTHCSPPSTAKPPSPPSRSLSSAPSLLPHGFTLSSHSVAASLRLAAVASPHLSPLWLPTAIHFASFYHSLFCYSISSPFRLLHYRIPPDDALQPRLSFSLSRSIQVFDNTLFRPVCPDFAPSSRRPSTLRA